MPEATGQNSTEVEAAALQYLDLGLTPIPVLGKEAATSWRRFQTERPTADELRRAYWGTDGFGVALVLGVDNLVVRDFDAPGTYRTWARRYPELARMLPTVKTGSKHGYHVYFRSQDVKTKCFDDGEFRGKGCYVVAPPSPHENLTRYRWLVPLVDPPYLDPYSVGLVPEKRARRPRVTQGVNSCISSAGTQPGRLVGAARTWQEAVERTLPKRVGERHRCLFNLCRQLKGIDQTRDCAASELEYVVRPWFRRALRIIRTKDWKTSWADFQSNWEIVRHPAGSASIERASAVVEEHGHPNCAFGLPLRLQRLAGVCCQLQLQHGAEPFFLSTRLAADVMGFTGSDSSRAMTGWRALQRLVACEILCVAARPSRGTRDAWSYRYLGDFPGARLYAA